MKVQPFILLILFAGLFLVIGIAVLLTGVSSSQQAIGSSQWPTVPGAVTASWVDSYITTPTPTSNGSVGAGSTFYTPQIRYSYIVSNRTFAGSQVGFGDYSSTDSSHAEQVTARYPVEQPVTVYYDPKNPAQAVLEPGFGAMLLIPLGIGSVFTLLGGLMLAGLLTARRRGLL